MDEWENFAPTLYQCSVTFLGRKKHYVGYSTRIAQRKAEHADRSHEWYPGILRARDQDVPVYDQEMNLGMVSYEKGFGFSQEAKELRTQARIRELFLTRHLIQKYGFDQVDGALWALGNTKTGPKVNKRISAELKTAWEYLGQFSAEDAWLHVSDPKWREVERAVKEFALAEVNGERRALRFIDAVQEFAPRRHRAGAKRAAPSSDSKRGKAARKEAAK